MIVQAEQVALATMEQPEPETQETREEIPVLSSVEFKPYMDYRAVTDQSSRQWELIQQADHETDGRLTIDGYALAALGKAFGPVGTRYVFTIDGKEVLIMKADEKQTAHTKDQNDYCGENGHILEMIIDTDLVSSEVTYHGDCSKIPELAGKIEKIEVITE